MKLIVLPLILVGLISTAYAQSTRPTPSLSVSRDGVMTIKLGSKVVADGTWGLAEPLLQPLSKNDLDLGKADPLTAESDAANHALIHQHFAAVNVTSDVSLEDEDLSLKVHIENHDATHPLTRVNLHGIFFRFSRIPDGDMHCWDMSYVKAQGLSSYHPSGLTPVGVCFAHDDEFGVSAWSPSEFDVPSLFNARWDHDHLSQQCEPWFLVTRAVGPGQAIDVTVTFRITSNAALLHLISGYKRLYDEHLPALFYHPDNRGVVQFAAVDKSFIARGNPLGFNGAFRRLDSDAGTRAYLRATAPLMQQRDMLGIIFWSPGGYSPPMYPPDFDQFPPSVQQNLPTLMAGYKKYGLRVGLCARCADGVTREPGKEPAAYRLSPDDPQQMKSMLDRFRHAMDMGFDIFYLDSMGATYDDLRILKQVREVVGPDVLLYTESCSDLSLPYAGHYCEWEKRALGGINVDTYKGLRYLCPKSTWLCMDRTHSHRLPDYQKAGVVPLVEDININRLPATRPASAPSTSPAR